MRVLQLISSAGFYGAENMLINLARSMNQLGCRSAVGIFENAHRPHTEIAEQARLEGLPVVLIPCKGSADWNAARAIRSYVEAHGIDLVHTHGYKADLYGYAAVRRLGTPIVATCHNWPGGSLALRAYASLDRRVLRRFPKVVAVSEVVSRMLQCSGVPPYRITLINNGIDLSRFDGASPTLASEIVKGCRPVVGTVGRLAPEKGLEHFLRAAQSLLGRFPEALFVLVGEGPARKSLAVLAQQLGIERSVIFTGQRRDLPGIYASLDVFVLASLNEGMPMTILEAMAAARAVVATRVGAIPRLVVPRTGLLVEPGEPAGLCDAVLRLLADPRLRHELGSRARERVAQVFSAEASAANYMKLYRELLERPPVCAARAPVQGMETVHSTGQLAAMARPDADSVVGTSMGSSPLRPVKVFLMDLWCCVPYYTSHLTKGLKAHNVEVTLG
jgi:glycosyltransferase involved in cell wall biosynthesis